MHVDKSATPDIGSLNARLFFSFYFFFLFLSPISSLCFLDLRHYAVDKHISWAPCLLDKHPKTFIHGVTAVITSAERSDTESCSALLY